jgi:hypothetical protein
MSKHNNKSVILKVDGSPVGGPEKISIPVKIDGQTYPLIVKPPHTIAMAQILAPIVAAFAPTMEPREAAAKAKLYVEAIFELVRAEAATEQAKQEAQNPDTQVQ